jgi:hypothetical protein
VFVLRVFYADNCCKNVVYVFVVCHIAVMLYELGFVGRDDCRILTITGSASYRHGIIGIQIQTVQNHTLPNNSVLYIASPNHFHPQSTKGFTMNTSSHRLRQTALLLGIAVVFASTSHTSTAQQPGSIQEINVQQTTPQTTVQTGTLISQDAPILQTRHSVTLHVGVAFPVGTFGQVVPTQSFTAAGTSVSSVSTTDSRQYGAALLGFGVGGTYQYKIISGVSFIGTLEGYYNALDARGTAQSFQSTLQNALSVASGTGTTFTTESSGQGGAYLNSFLLLGGRYDFPLLSGFSVYALAQGGLGYNVLPGYGVQFSYRVASPTGVNFRLNNSTDWTSAGAASFAGAFGIGALIGERFQLGVRYTTAVPSFTQTVRNVREVSNSGPAGIAFQQNQVVRQEVTTNFFLPVNILSVSLGYVIGW